MSSIYSEINHQGNMTQWNYEQTSYDSYGLSDDYELLRKIGRGKYSEVFLGIDIMKSQKVVVKVLKPVRQAKIEREIMVLHRMQGVDNVIGLVDVVKERGSQTPCFIMEYIENAPDTKGLLQKMSGDDLAYYMYQLAHTLC